MKTRTTLWVGLFALVWGFTHPRLAGAVVDVQTEEPAANTTYTMTEDAFMEVSPRDSTWNGTRLFLSGQYNVINQPLVEYDPTHTYRTAVLVSSINTLDLSAGVFAKKDIEAVVNLPLNYSQVTGDSNKFGLGDMRLLAKIRIPADYEKIAFAIIPEIFIPTGNQSLFLSNGSVGVGITGVLEADLGPVRGAVNIGYRHTDGATYLDINYENLIPWSVGILWPFSPPWALDVEAVGALALPVNRFNNPSELYFGARYQIHKDLDAHAGFSIGALGAGASGDLRGVLGIRYSPTLGSSSTPETTL